MELIGHDFWVPDRRETGESLSDWDDHIKGVAGGMRGPNVQRLGQSSVLSASGEVGSVDEAPPAPAGRTIADVHAERGSRPATAEEFAEFEQRFGPLLPTDGEG